MKVAELVEQRRKNWQELEQLCELAQRMNKRKMGAARVSRFATLYRAACADLALADSYQLPPNTVQYLHRLVGRAHNQLYRSRDFDYAKWSDMLLVEAPQRIFNDRCVQLAFCLFWGGFILSAILAYSENLWPNYAQQMLSQASIDQMEDMFSEPISGRDPQASFAMAGFYIQHNTTIGLKCFAGGVLVIPGLFITMFNAVALGASFGYMARPDVAASPNFFHFVTAHGPFELTAIVLSAGAGLRIGIAWLYTRGLTRIASLQKSGREAIPIMGAAIVMFILAAMIEGFLSPSAAPYWLKATVAVISTGMLTFYFVILGLPREVFRALDNTHIAVKERKLNDICDLSLHVLARYWRPIVLLSLAGALPLALINHLLIGWMMGMEYRETSFYIDESSAIARYVWNMSILIAIEAPLGSILATTYLGQAVFVDQPRIREVCRDVFKMLPRVIWCQLIVRGILPAWLLLLALPRYGDFDPAIEVFFLLLLALYAVGLRVFRPFINEIVLLEKNPLLSRDSKMMTVGRRSVQLHGPSSADLFPQGLAMSTLTVCLAIATFSTLVFIKGVFMNSWKVSPSMLLYALPLSCWLVAIYLNVVRFLRYMDLRIRHEGWEVELRMRAEANRLLNKPS